ncbi:hypothetical protein Prubr_16790 [Polymorphospora rubra]|uniref:ABC transporter domain-containing protein n=1 Tax=Polymorphospora rubra TaxID=338584 RepID=A0A810MZ54_9ACTN|nr:hypothetical protein Prubr_16790 [Polymorphospora rubra]
MSSEPILSINDLSVRIAGLHILQGVSFDVAASGVTVLLGRNGVGKTTTLRAVLGLTPRGGEVRGTVRIGGRDITDQATHRVVRDGLGYVPEDRGIFAGLTVAENLRLAERRGNPRRTGGSSNFSRSWTGGRSSAPAPCPAGSSRCSPSAGSCSTTTGCC